MTLTADIRMEEIALTETEGVHDNLVRKYLITNIPTTYSDTRRLSDALTAIGLPIHKSYAPGNTNLICVGRQVAMEPNSTTTAVATITYMPVARSKSTFIFSGGTNLSQETTSNDIQGNQLTTSHTWPSDDPQWPDQTHTQGASPSVLLPSTTMTATGTLNVVYPDAMSTLWVGSTNAAYWSGTAPGYWMCTRCDFRGTALGIGQTSQWEFTFEFQYKYTGWPIQIWFVDPRTGEPPPNLVPGTGLKTIDWYGEIDFNYLFPNT